MRVCCVSDLHEHLVPIPECDLLLIAGDISFAFKGDLATKQGFLMDKFEEWAHSIDAMDIIVVAGNHDQSIEKWGWPLSKWMTNIVYLQDAEINLQGVKIWGTPWQPYFFDWAFNAPRRNGELFLAEKYAQIPDDVDIIVSHGPPHGVGDLTPTGEHVGSTALRDRILEIQPKLVVCGHIHEAFGEYELGDTKVVNASLVNRDYEPSHPPIVLNL